MAVLVSDLAICLRTMPFSETSQIVTLLTQQHGLLRLIAKGAHRTTKAGSNKFDGGIDLLDEGQCVFSDRLERELNVFTEWKILNGRRELRAAPRRMHLALYLAELIDQLLEVRDEAGGLFDRFRWTLDALSTDSIEEASLALSFDALQTSGLDPVLDQCVMCGRSFSSDDRQVFQIPELGGVACRACAEQRHTRYPTDIRLIALARQIRESPRDGGAVIGLPRVSIPQSDRLHALVIRHVRHQLGRQLRTAKYAVTAWMKTIEAASLK